MLPCYCPALRLDYGCEIIFSKSVSVSEEGKTFELISEKDQIYWICSIDKGLLKYATYSRRCDYGIYIDGLDVVYLIELKGRKINVAIEQIKATIKLMEPFLKCASAVHAIIIAFRSSPKSIKFSITKLSREIEKEFGGSLKWTDAARMSETLN